MLTDGYIELVRYHREKAFDEGVLVMIGICASQGQPITLPLPENPYKIKEVKE